MTRQNIIFRGILFTTLFSFIFTSCDWLFSSTEQTVTADKVISWEYDEDKPWVEIDPSVIQISISNLPLNRRIYLSKTNPTENAISGEYTQTVYSADGIDLDGSAESLSEHISSTRSAAETTEVTDNTWHCFIPEEVEMPVISSRSVNITVGTGDDAPEKDCDSAGYEVGSHAYFYIDTASNKSSGNPTNYQLAKCYLRGKGDYCNVWVVDGYYDGDSGTKYYYTYQAGYGEENVKKSNSYNVDNTNIITADFVTEVQNKFDTMYVPITYIFGDPSDQILSWDHDDYVPLSYYDDTWSDDYKIKDPVNIIIYDIGADLDGGIYGYFWGKDYYTNPTNHVSASLKSQFPSNSTLWYSNEGKFFYIDSYYANTDEDEIISTLAHEFQHMIEFNEKTIKYGLSYGSAHKEMKSMICEDLMKELLDNMSNSSSTISGPVTRLPHFAGSYLYNGVEEYSDSLTILSYAEAYAFGAFLIRNYGGVDFVKELCTNDKVEMEGIIAAIKTVTGKTVTKADIMRDFALACTNENYDVSAYPRFYTIDKDTHNGQTTTYNSGVPYIDYTTTPRKSDNYFYPISPINIFNMSDQKDPEGDSSDLAGNSVYYTLSYNGPIKYLANIYGPLRPYGIMLHYLGLSTDSEATITFYNDTINKDQHLYLVVDNELKEN
jgi:hypothetical protein